MVDFELIFEVDSRVDFERWSEPALKIITPRTLTDLILRLILAAM